MSLGFEILFCCHLPSLLAEPVSVLRLEVTVQEDLYSALTIVGTRRDPISIQQHHLQRPRGSELHHYHDRGQRSAVAGSDLQRRGRRHLRGALSDWTHWTNAPAAELTCTQGRPNTGAS